MRRVKHTVFDTMAALDAPLPEGMVADIWWAVGVGKWEYLATWRFGERKPGGRYETTCLRRAPEYARLFSVGEENSSSWPDAYNKTWRIRNARFPE